MYPYGYCLYAFDLPSDLAANSFYWHLIRNGSLHVEISFNISFTEGVNFVYKLIEVDKYRNVTTDYK